MLPTVSQVCSLPAAFELQLEDYASGGIRSLEIWLTKLEDYLASLAVADPMEHLRAKLREFELATPVASWHGGLVASQGEKRREAWEHWTRRLAMCRAAEIETMVVACDVSRPLDQSAIQRVQVSLAELATQAGAAGIRVALEFQATSAFGNNLQTAAALVAEVGSPHLGLCLDVYHFHVGPSKYDDLGLLSRDNLFLVQLSDLADVPRELASDVQRILPGDGDIPLAPLIQRLKDIEYQGPVSAEILNPQLWQTPPRQFGEIALQALQRAIGADAR